MSHSLYIIVDGILVFFFLLVTFNRKSPVYLLGIPFLLFMGRAILFDREATNWTRYTGMNGIWVIIFFLLIVWFLNIIWQSRISRVSQKPFTLFGGLSLNKGEIPILLLFVLWSLNTGLNAIRFSNISDVLLTSFDACSIFVGYVLVRGIVANADLKDAVGFIESLCLITAVSAFLFFLHQGLKINTIYEYDLNVSSFGGRIVSRNTWYFPPLIYVLFSYGLAANHWNKYIALGWILALMTYLFSYTRTYILGSLFLIIFAYILRFIKYKSTKYIGKLLIVLAGICMIGWLCYILLPVQSTYLAERLYQGFIPHGSGEGNLAVRWTFIMETWEKIKPYNLFGIGSPGLSNFSFEYWTKRWVFDSWIVMALQYWGIAGLGLILFAFYFGIRQALIFFFSSDEKLQFCGLLFTLILIAVLIEGVFGPIFMEPYRYPLGFWYFAFLYGMTINLRMKRLSPQNNALVVETVHALSPT